MRKMRQVWRFVMVALIFAVFGLVAIGCGRLKAVASDENDAIARVAYPKGYRSWTHVKSMAVLEGHENYNAFGGIHHVYANDKALAALKGGKPFVKGAVLVFDLLEEKTENNAIVEGPRKVIGVMEKNPARFADTEGWGFEDFKMGDPRQRSVTDMRAQCLSCHVSQKASDFVYSRYRE